MVLSLLIRRAFVALWTYFFREWDVKDLRSHRVIEPAILHHLKLVYSSLIHVSISSAFGSYFCLTGRIENSVAVFGAFVNTICFYSVSPRKQNTRLRLCLLNSGAFFGGALLAPWIIKFLNVDTAFVVFSLSSGSVIVGGYLEVCKQMNHYTIWAKIWPYTYIFGFHIALIYLAIASAVIGGDVSRLKVVIFLAYYFLWVYMGAYSQEILLKARRGDGNYLKHAITFFTDFPGVFLHTFLVTVWYNICWFIELPSFVRQYINELKRINKLK